MLRNVAICFTTNVIQRETLQLVTLYKYVDLISDKDHDAYFYKHDMIRWNKDRIFIAKNVILKEPFYALEGVGIGEPAYTQRTLTI